MKAGAVFYKQCGVNNPNEKTVQTFVATVSATRIQLTNIDVNFDTRLFCVRTFKDTLRAIPKEFDGPTEYPETPAQLQEKVPCL